MDTLEIAPLDRQIPRDGRPTGKTYGFEIVEQLIVRDVDSDIDVHEEFDALGTHLFDSSFDETLLKFELRNTQRQQTADVLVTLKHSDRVPRPRQLLRGRQARGPRSHNGNRLSGFDFCRFRLNPAFAPATVRYRLFDHFDRYRLRIYRKGA